MSIKVVVFDLGNVIFNYDLSKFVNAYVKKIPGHVNEDINKLIFEYSDLAASYEQGNITSTDFYELLAKKTHYTGSYNEFCVIWNNIFKPVPGTIEIIARLAEKKYRLGILSNTNELHFEFLKAGYPAIFLLFEKLHLSYEMHMRKPDDNIFREVIKYYGTAPQEIFFTDDLNLNAESAQSNGISAHRFINPPALIEQLKTEKVEI